MRFLVSLIALSLFFMPSAAASYLDYDREELNGEYSMEDSRFHHVFSDGRYFITTVPNGQITPGMVSVVFSNGLDWMLERNGQAMAYDSGDYLFQTGNYSFVILSPQSGIYAEFDFQIAEVTVQSGISDRAETVILNHSYENGVFRYTFENGGSFSANIPNGGITNHGVQIKTDRELICLLTKDGAVIRYETGGILTEEGYYHMRVISPMAIEIPDISWITDSGASLDDITQEEFDRMLEELENGLEDDDEPLQSLQPGAIYQTVFSFRILTGAARSLPMFNVPNGFGFGTVTLDGAEIEPSGINYHRFTRDGGYVFVLKDKSGQAPDQVVTLNIDATPPVIRLEGVTKGYAASGAVTVTANKDGLRWSAYRSNMEVTPKDTYTESGRYTVIAVDGAGNSASAAFEITYTPPKNMFLLIILAVLLAAVGYVIYSRRSMTVG